MYERSRQTKLDAIDLILTTIMEHEKRLDELISRLEKHLDRVDK